MDEQQKINGDPVDPPGKTSNASIPRLKISLSKSDRISSGQRLTSNVLHDSNKNGQIMPAQSNNSMEPPPKRARNVENSSAENTDITKLKETLDRLTKAHEKAVEEVNLKQQKIHECEINKDQATDILIKYLRKEVLFFEDKMNEAILKLSQTEAKSKKKDIEIQDLKTEVEMLKRKQEAPSPIPSEISRTSTPLFLQSQNTLTDDVIKQLMEKSCNETMEFVKELISHWFTAAEILDTLEASEKITELKKIMTKHFERIDSAIWKNYLTNILQSRRNKITSRFYAEFKKFEYVIMTGSIKDPKFYKCEIRNNGEYVYEASGTSFLPVSSITEEVILGEKAQYGTNHKLYKFDALKGVKTFLFEKTRDNSRKSAK